MRLIAKQSANLLAKAGIFIYVFNQFGIFTINTNNVMFVNFCTFFICFAYKLADCFANISDLNKEWMNPWQQISPDWWNDFKREIRVIGNAFDNPELMKEGANHEYAI